MELVNIDRYLVIYCTVLHVEVIGGTSTDFLYEFDPAFSEAARLGVGVVYGEFSLVREDAVAIFGCQIADCCICDRDCRRHLDCEHVARHFRQVQTCPCFWELRGMVDQNLEHQYSEICRYKLVWTKIYKCAPVPRI